MSSENATTAETISVQILDREFHVACSQEQRRGLLAAANHLDQNMRDIRGAGRVVGMDRIAVMAALNLAHELLELKQNGAGSDSKISDGLQQIKAKLDRAIETVSGEK